VAEDAGAIVSYDVVEAESFWDCVRSLSKDDDYQADLMKALIELRTEPFRNPKLQTHDVGKAKNGKLVFSSDVGGLAATAGWSGSSSTRRLSSCSTAPTPSRTAPSGCRSTSIRLSE
jgi:hypothetical protein